MSATFTVKRRINNIIQFVWKQLGYPVRHKGSNPRDQQDKWVERVLRKKRNGYFLDIGCKHAHASNNSYLLETKYGWTGKAVDPFPSGDWAKLRPKSKLIRRPVSDVGDQEVDFVNPGTNTGGLKSTIGRSGANVKRGVKGTTISPRQMLQATPASPREVDYMSIDVEGQEYAIIKAFPFDEYLVRCISVEHNTSIHLKGTHGYEGQCERQEKIMKLLKEKGFVFVGANRGDDFFVHKSHFDTLTPEEEKRVKFPKLKRYRY